MFYWLNWNFNWLYWTYTAKKPASEDPCNPSPCGPNANCNNGICSCLTEYQGDPYLGCRPECVLNSDCPRDKACIRNKCSNPCPGICGLNAVCDVINHVPMCSCPNGMAGNAFEECKLQQSPVISNPCNPSPCGQNSQCRVLHNQAVCTCLPGFIGSAPYCRPECVIDSDCSLQLNCRNFKCVDPCPGYCGINSLCQTINHNPTCTCPRGKTGNPQTRCYEIGNLGKIWTYVNIPIELTQFISCRKITTSNRKYPHQSLQSFTLWC